MKKYKKQTWRKYLQNTDRTNDLFPESIKNSLNSTVRKQTIPLKKLNKRFEWTFHQRGNRGKDIQHRQTLKTCKFKHNEVALEIYKLAKILKVLLIPTVTTIRATESFIHCYGTVK